MRTKIKLQKQIKDKTFQEGYNEFIIYCKSRNLRPATIHHYDNSIRIFQTFIPDIKIKNINEKLVQDFKIFLQNKMNENDVTINTNIRSLRAVLYYFMKLNYMKSFHISEIKTDKDVIQTYTDAEIKLLLKKPNLKQCDFIMYKTWVIINFLLGTGCRAGTLINIKVQDIDFENNLITYRYTKNRKQQIIPLSNTLKIVLLEYLQYRNGKPDDWLFINAFGDKLSVDQLNHNIAKYNHKRGVTTTGVHRFRHTFAKKWILNHGDVFRLQKILCHSNMDMVKNYVNMFTDDLEKDFNEFNPLEQIKVINKKHIKMIKNNINE